MSLLTSSAVKGLQKELGDLREEHAANLASIEASLGIQPEADASTESRIEAITEAVAEIQGTARDALVEIAEIQKEAKGHAEALKAEFDKGKTEAEQAAQARIYAAEAAAKEKADAEIETTVSNRTAAQLRETMGAIGNPPVKVDDSDAEGSAEPKNQSAYDVWSRKFPRK